MMKLIFVFLIAFSSLCVAQNSNVDLYKYKSSFAIQFNPTAQTLEQLIWSESAPKNIVLATRYSYRPYKNFYFGPEFSLWRRNVTQDSQLISRGIQYNFGAFARYSINKLPFVKPFLESSLYFSHVYSMMNFFEYYEIRYNSFAGYIAPGISFCFVKSRINLDILYKFSNSEFVNEKNHIISWRLGYNFNFKK